MPPILMLVMVIAVVLLVAMGKNPLDQLRAEQEKYGKDPLTREINKFNEEKTKKNMKTMGGELKYTPPEGAKVYRLPPSQVIRPVNNNPMAVGLERAPPAPPPEIPMSDWGKTPYSPTANTQRISNEKPYEIPTAPVYNTPSGQPSSEPIPSPSSSTTP